MNDKDNHLYFKQIEMGPMQNFVYLIGSTQTRKVAVVDAAWEIDEIIRLAAQDDMEITHAFVTHTHPDHVGGRFAGVEIEGVTELLSKCKAKVVVHKAEAEFLKALSASDVIKTESGDKIERRRHRDSTAAHAGPYARIPVLPGGQSDCFGGHAVYWILRTDRLTWEQSGTDVL